MNFMELIVKIGADTSGLDSGMNQAESKAGAFSKKLGSGLKTAAKIGTAALVAVGTAATVATNAMINNAGEVAAYGDNIDKMSQKMGLTAEAYQEWDAVMQHSGTSMESMKASMKTLANAAETGNEAFKQLGITEEQLATMNQQELFEATIAGLQNVESTTERTYLAGKLLGRGATELGALLNTSAEETQAMRDRVHELGGVMSDEAVKASAQFQDNLQDLQTTFAGIKRGIVSDMLPGLNSLMSGLTKLLIGEEGAEEAIEQGIDELLTNVEKGLDKAITLGEKIIPRLVEGIVNHLPQFMNMGLMIIETLGRSLIDNAPELIRSGLTIILTLANSLIESLPELIPAIVDIILEIVDVLTEPDTLVQLIDAALQIIIALAEGLIKALPKIIEKLPIIITNIVDTLIQLAPKLLEAAFELIATLATGLIEYAPKAVSAVTELFDKIKEKFLDKIGEAAQWGKDMIDNFIGGIKDKIGNVKDAISNVGQSIKDRLHFSEPDEGPLSDFHTYAPDMMDLFIKGIADNEDRLKNQIERTFDFGNVIESVGASTVQVQPAMAIGGMSMNPLDNITLVFPIYLGGDKIDEKIINAIDAYNFKSGGRA